jgi:hypothetical protein
MLLMKTKSPLHSVDFIIRNSMNLEGNRNAGNGSAIAFWCFRFGGRENWRCDPPQRLKYRNNIKKRSKSMMVRQARYIKEEFARRGDEIYETQVRSQVEAGNHGKIVAIDIETGAYEVGENINFIVYDLLYRVTSL